MMRLSRSIWRIVTASLFAIVVIYTLRVLLKHNNDNVSNIRDHSQKPNLLKTARIQPNHKYWQEVFEVLAKGLPDVPQGSIDTQESSTVDRSLVYSRHNLLARAKISDEHLMEFSKKHAYVLAHIKDLTTAAYKPKTSGVAIVGGGRFLWLAYLSIVALRNTGLTLPVEVILPKHSDQENEINLCTEIFPKLNAQCVTIPDVLGPQVMLNWHDKLENYQFKVLALVCSSFQNVLLVDADNFILSNPEDIINSDLFKKYGMVTWPDYWDRVTTPMFYDITGVKVDLSKLSRYNRLPFSQPFKIQDSLNVPFHDLEGTIPNLSTESGQFLINKATHSKTLLMSLYYNMYGPLRYYRLLSLGDSGEGDKDTFAAAAVVSGQNYYQVKLFIKTFGYADDSNEYHGVAMGQKNPLEDYKIYKNVMDQMNTKASMEDQTRYLKDKIDNEFNGNNDIPLFALHCNFPKLDPMDLMLKDLYDKEKKQLKYRMFANYKYKKEKIVDGKKALVDEDFELVQWKNIKQALCDRKYKFPYFAKADMDEVCEFARNQVTLLSSS